MAPTNQDIESELSYAYLHAVAAQAGASCISSNRLEDNAGIDASLTIFGPFTGAKFLKEVDLKVQLKATIKKPAETDNHFSYAFSGIKQYDNLRSTEAYSTPRILAVLFLPPDKDDWLECGLDGLILRKCCYWVSLRGAPSSTNTTSQTIHIPKSQALNPLGLRSLGEQIALRKLPNYTLPT